MFVASDFCFTAVELALEDAGKLKPTGEAGHMWIAAQDVNPLGYTAMLKGYIDVATSYDAYFHVVEVVKVLGRIANGEDLKGQEFLVPGRVATPQNLKAWTTCLQPSTRNKALHLRNSVTMPSFERMASLNLDF